MEIMDAPQSDPLTQFLFAEDLILYLLNKKWTQSPSFHIFNKYVKTEFSPEIGKAVSLLSKIFAQQLNAIKQQYVELFEEHERYFMDFAFSLAEEIIENNVFLDFIMYCGTIITVADFLFQNEYPKVLNHAVVVISLVFDVKIKQKFEIQGGWKSLRQFCDELISNDFMYLQSQVSNSKQQSLNITSLLSKEPLLGKSLLESSPLKASPSTSTQWIQLLFAEDLISFVLDNKWTPCLSFHSFRKYIRTEFSPEMGKAVSLVSSVFIYQLNTTKKEQISIFQENEHNFMDFAFHLAETIIQNNLFFSFIMFCGNLITVAEYLFQNGQPKFLNYSIVAIALVFDLKVKQKFKAEGGWNGFRQFCNAISLKDSANSFPEISSFEQTYSNICSSSKESPSTMSSSLTIACWSQFLFAEDLVSYVLDKKLSPCFSIHCFRKFLKTEFSPEVGIAVSLVSKVFTHELYKVKHKYTPMFQARNSSFMEFVICMADKSFNNGVFLDFILFCGTIIDLAGHLFQNGYPQFLNYTIVAIRFIFDFKLKQDFETEGGWESFRKFCTEFIAGF